MGAMTNEQLTAALDNLVEKVNSALRKLQSQINSTSGSDAGDSDLYDAIRRIESIEQIVRKSAKEILDAKNAVELLDETYLKVNEIEGDSGKFHYLSVDSLDAGYIRADKANIDEAWVKDLMTIGGVFVDHIIERGTAGIYTYEKYASGTMKVWGVYEFSGVACTTAFGSATGWYRTGAISPPNYPVPFIEPPVLSYSWRPASVGVGAEIWRSDPGRTDRPNSVNLLRPGSLASMDGAIDISAVGRWKEDDGA